MTPPLVALQGVSVSFPVHGGMRSGGWFGRRARLRAVDDVTLSVLPDETLALVGESGSGKSTLGNVVAGLQPPSAGRVLRAGAAASAAGRPRRRGAAVQMVFQDPFDALDPRMTVAAIVAEPLRIARLGSARERRERVAALLAQVGLPPDALNRFPHEFSGGQRQRVAIARALAADPALVVADEPLSALDVSIQSQILNLLRDVQAERRLSYLFISHDMGVVNHLADRVAVLYLGRLVELAPRAALFARPAHPYTAALLRAVPRLGARRRGAVLPGEMPSPLPPPPGCAFHTRCPKAAPRCIAERPALAPLADRPQQRAACHFPD